MDLDGITEWFQTSGNNRERIEMVSQIDLHPRGPSSFYTAVSGLLNASPLGSLYSSHSRQMDFGRTSCFTMVSDRCEEPGFEFSDGLVPGVGKLRLK